MLPSKERLNRAQFTDLLNNSEVLTIFNKVGTLKFTKNLYNKGFSVVLSKKNEKSAVKRNLLKRRVFSIIQSFLKEYTDFSITGIIYLSKNAYIMEFSSLKTGIYDLLKKTSKNT